MDFSFVLAPVRLAENHYCAMCGSLLDTVDDADELGVLLWVWKGKSLLRICDADAKRHSGAIYDLSAYLRKKSRAIRHVLGHSLPPPRFQIHVIPYADAKCGEPRIVREVEHIDDRDDADDLFPDDPDADCDDAGGREDVDVSMVG